MRKYSKFMAVFLVVAMLLPGIAQAAPVVKTGAEVTRIGGVDRVGTSVLASQEAYDKADAVVLAGFGGDVDALTGTLLAANKKAPLLVTRKNQLSAEVKTEIERLGAKNVYILGGANAVNEEVVTALKALNLTVKRIAGEGRNETAAKVAKEVKGEKAESVFLALGREATAGDALADALAIGPVSAMKNMPVLLTETNKVPAATIQAMKDLGVKNVTIVGGTAAVSAEVEKQLAKDYKVDRVEGTSREKTAIAIAKRYFEKPSNLIVAYGRKSADALVGGYLGAIKNAPILLTNKAGVTAEIKAYMEANVLDTFVLGGGTVVTDTVYTQVKEIIEGKVTDEVAIESVSAINAKTLKVTFNKAVADKTKAVFGVTRDGFKVNYSKVEFADDAMSATVELTSKIIKGEYAVTVTGLTDEALVGTVTTEGEKVAKIEVLSTEVPLTNIAVEDGSGTIKKGDGDLAVPYKVTNQYGEDVTKTTSIVASAGSVDTSKGLVNFTGQKYNTTTNKTVAFTLINVESNVSTTAVVTAVSASTESEVEIKGLYNKDSKTLTETTDLSKDKFYLEIEVKDQYGKVIKNPTKSNLIISETNNTVINVEDITQTPELKTNVVEGKVLIELKKPENNDLKAGESIVTLISRNTGKSSNYKIVVEEGVRVNTLTLGQPEITSAGEKALIPVTAVDKKGNVITDLKILNSDTRGIKLAVGHKLVKKDGGIFLETGITTEGPQVVLVTVLPTQTISTVNFTVRAAAKPNVITGLDKNIQTSINTGLSQEIKAEDLIIEDQFGRIMTKAAINTWIGIDKNAIVVTSSKDDPDNSPFKVEATDASGDLNKQILKASDKVLTITAKDAVNVNEVKTEKMTFALSIDDGVKVVASTSKDIVFTKVAIADFASYEVKAPKAIFNEAVGFDLKVYGIKSDGAKVLLKDDAYNLILANGFEVAKSNGNNVIKLTEVLGDNVIVSPATATVPVSKDFDFKVVIKDNDATTINTKVTVSAEAKKVAAIGASATNKSTGTELTKLSFVPSNKTVIEGTNAQKLTATQMLDFAALENFLYFVDQYDVESATKIADTKVNLTFSNVKTSSVGEAKPVIDKNGQEDANVTKLIVGDTLTVKVEANGVVKTYDVVIVDGTPTL